MVATRWKVGMPLFVDGKPCEISMEDVSLEKARLGASNGKPVHDCPLKRRPEHPCS